MTDKDLDKLAAEMKNIKPSQSAKQRAMDAAMAAFDAEFALDNVAATEEISTPAQGSTAEPRPTGHTTSIRRVETPRSGIMSKFKNSFTFNPKATMMVGSCAAALMFALVIVPNATNNVLQNPLEEKFSVVSSALGSNEIVVTGAGAETSPPKVKDDAQLSNDALLSVEKIVKPAAPQTVQPAPEPEAASSDILRLTDGPSKVRTDKDVIASTNAKREMEVRQRLNQKTGQLAAVQAPTVPQMAPSIAQSAPNPPSTSQSNTTQISGGYILDGVPAEYKSQTKTVERRVLKTPARTVERVVPSVTKQATRRVQNDDGSFRTITETIVVQEASTQLVTLPPVYETVMETIVVQPDGRDQFESVEFNPLTQAKETPVSTFSVDVDTASYSFFRSSINRGVLPPASSIRLEEMINYFPYDYDAPTSLDEPFKANVTVTPTPWNADTKLMHIGIKGYVPDVDERPRSNIVLLIDTSGSMRSANKLPLLVNSFKLLLNTLDDDDTVSIVTYAGSAGTVLEPTSASDKNKINAALNNLRSGGSTAGAAGLELAYLKAQESFDEDGINRVILATDGDFNVGFSSPDEMKTFITKKRETGIFLSVLGFGNGNYNDHLMQALAQNGNGVAAYIDSLAEANKVLANEAGSALMTIAKDVKIQVEFNPATIAEYRLIGYETRALKREDFNNDKVDAGEINSGHSVTAIYEMTPVGSRAVTVDDLRYVNNDDEDRTTGSDEFAFVKIRHKLPNSDTSTLQTFPVGPNQDRKLKRASDDMRFATAVAAVGQKLRGDTQLSDFSYQDAIKLANSAKGDDDHGYRAEFIQLVRLVESMEK